MSDYKPKPYVNGLRRYENSGWDLQIENANMSKYRSTTIRDFFTEGQVSVGQPGSKEMMKKTGKR